MCDGIKLCLDALVSPGRGPFVPRGKPWFCFRLHCLGSIFTESKSGWNESLEPLAASRPDLALSLTKGLRKLLGRQWNYNKLGKKLEGSVEEDIRFV